MGYGAMMDFLGAAIAYVRSLIEPGAALFLKAFTGLITGRAGSTLDVTYNHFSTNIALAAMIAMDTEVVGIIECAFVQFRLNILTAIKSKVFLVSRMNLLIMSSFYCCQRERQP